MNKFYKRSCFQLVKVVFSESNPTGYTYAAHEKYKLKMGDLVVVMTGPEDIDYQAMQVARVKAITSDMKFMPREYKIKHIVDKINTTRYDKLRNHTKGSKAYSIARKHPEEFVFPRYP